MNMKITRGMQQSSSSLGRHQREAHVVVVVFVVVMVVVVVVVVVLGSLPKATEFCLLLILRQDFGFVLYSSGLSIVSYLPSYQMIKCPHLS